MMNDAPAEFISLPKPKYPKRPTKSTEIHRTLQMGYVVKFLFFLMGAPMLVSFYSVWLFEVGYGLAQCFLSVIFLTQLTYMDLSFRGTLKPMVRLQAKKLMDVCGKLAKKMGALK